MKAILPVPRKLDAAIPRHTDQSRIEVDPSASSFAGNRLGKVDFPPQSVVHRQFSTNAISILAIEEPTLLSFAGIELTVYIASELAHISEKESSQTQTSAVRSLRAFAFKDEPTYSWAEASKPEILRIADIGAPFQNVVTGGLGPNISPFGIIFFFQKGATSNVNQP